MKKALPILLAASAFSLISGLIISKNYHKKYENKPENLITLIKDTPALREESTPKPTPEVPLTKVKLPKNYDSVFLGEVNDESALKLINDIKAASDQKQVTIRITSPGGSVSSMLAIIQNIEDLKKQKGFKLVCVGDIMAASAAFIILETSCDTRLMTYRTILLAHGVQGASDAINIATKADDLHAAELIERMVSVAVAKRMKMPLETYLQWILGRNRWLGPEEAIKYHAVDGVIDPLNAPSPTPDN